MKRKVLVILLSGIIFLAISTIPTNEQTVLAFDCSQYNSYPERCKAHPACQWVVNDQNPRGVCVEIPTQPPPATDTPVPYIPPPRPTDTSTPTMTATTEPTRTQTPTAKPDDTGLLPDAAPPDRQDPFSAIPPAVLPWLIGLGLLILGGGLALVLRPLLFHNGQPGGDGPAPGGKGWSSLGDYAKVVEQGDPASKGWSDVGDYAKVEDAVPSGKGWSDLVDFPKVEGADPTGKGWSDLHDYPKVEQGDPAGKGWSDLTEFPKIEQGDPTAKGWSDVQDMTDLAPGDQPGKGWSDTQDFEK